MGDQPDLKIDLRSQAAIVSLAARDADLAIRMSAPDGASLMAKKLPAFALGLFASVAYLNGRDPMTIDPSAERLLTVDEGFGRIPETDWVTAAGVATAVVSRSNSVRALFGAARAGVGIALLPAVFARREGLMEIPTPIPLPPRIPYLVTHRDQRRRPEVRAVHAWVVESFLAVAS